MSRSTLMRETVSRDAGAIGIRAAFAALALLVPVVATAAQAADTPGPGPSEAIFVADIVLLVLTGRLFGELMQRIGQPAVMGQLVAGLVLGPSIFGAVWPQAQQALFPTHGEQRAMIDAVAQFGVLMLLLLTGMETDLGLAKRAGKASLFASVAGICVPFGFGFALGEFLPDALLPSSGHRLVTALLLGTALSISSVKIVALVVREMDFLRRKIGQVIVASAIIDDTIGWIIIALTLSLARQGKVDLGSLATSVVGTVLFLGASFTIGRRLVFQLIRWSNDSFVSEAPVIAAVLVFMGTMALITSAIGVSTVLGAFVAGMLVGQSPILGKYIDEQLRGLITALFMPVFFGLSGLNADLKILGHPQMLTIFGALILIATIGKFSGAFVGGRLGGLTRPECLALACGMNARGSTEVIVATIGLSMGVLSHDLFTMIVGMAVTTTLAMPPMLRWALGRLPLGDDERQRLGREASEARGFVSNLERLLIAVDDSPTGKFASRLAGLLAGSRGMPVTLLRLEKTPTAAQKPEAAILEAAQKSSPVPDKEAQPGVDVTVRVATTPRAEAVASATKRGHDLLVIGLKRTVAPEGGFHPYVADTARGFAGPLAIASARGVHLQSPLEAGLDILVPVTGTDASRRGAEVALALARATGARITALHVEAAAESDPWRRLQPKQDNAALQREIARLAEQYGVTMHTTVRINIAPEDAILRQARLGGHNLIVMGVSRRAGDILSFGRVAASVLESAERSLLFVSTAAT